MAADGDGDWVGDGHRLVAMSIVYAVLLQYANGGDFGMYYAAAETLRFSPHSDVYSLQTLSATVLAHGGCGSPPNLHIPINRCSHSY